MLWPSAKEHAVFALLSAFYRSQDLKTPVYNRKQLRNKRKPHDIGLHPEAVTLQHRLNICWENKKTSDAHKQEHQGSS